jgi:hypothetical protein
MRTTAGLLPKWGNLPGCRESRQRKLEACATLGLAWLHLSANGNAQVSQQELSITNLASSAKLWASARDPASVGAVSCSLGPAILAAGKSSAATPQGTLPVARC